MHFKNEFCETGCLRDRRVAFTINWMMELQYQLMYTVAISAYIKVVKQNLTVAV
jgi:hypothetical protein